MRFSRQNKLDHLRHFAKDDAKTRLLALALVMAPAILVALAAVLSVVLNKI